MCEKEKKHQEFKKTRESLTKEEGRRRKTRERKRRRVHRDKRQIRSVDGWGGVWI